MYSREVADRELTFGVSGKLIRNVLVMYDRETDTLWPQLTGEAIEGELVGEKLEFLPAIHTTWAEWSAEFPDTLALYKGYYGDADNYADYYTSDRTGVIPETFADDRLYVKEYVIGVEAGSETAAYPYSVLNGAPVVNDVVGEVPIVVMFSAESGAARAFDRRFEGQTLTFTLKNGRILDNETGSEWNRITGIAIAGDLTGSQLTAVKSTRTFWFGWKDWFPDTRLYTQ